MALTLCAACSDDAEPPTSQTSQTTQTTPDDTGPTDTGNDADLDTHSNDVDATPDVAPDTTPEPLRANAGPNINAYISETVTLDASASTGDIVSYTWDLGNNGDTADGPTAQISYDLPGRYRVVLTVTDSTGKTRRDDLLVTIVEPPTFTPQSSSTVSFSPSSDLLAVVSRDRGELTLTPISEDGTTQPPQHIPVCSQPRTLTFLADPTLIAVTCQGDDRVVAVNTQTAQVAWSVSLPYGSAPYGIIHTSLNNTPTLVVSLQGKAQLALLQPSPNATGWTLTQRWDTVPDTRALALLPDNRVAVTRWRSNSEHGEVAAVNLLNGSNDLWTIPFGVVPSDSDTETGGVPTYLNSIAVRPDGREVALPSTQANIREGAFLSGSGLTHETTVRAVVSYIDPTTGLPSASRKQFDDRGLASAAVYTTWGDFLFIATRGSRAIERIDRFTGAQSGTILAAGFAPEGLAISPNNTLLAVDASLSREVRIYDIATSSLPRLLSSTPSVSSEPFSPTVLLGAQLFNDAFDTRLAQDSYIACAHCHLEGDSDRLVWDFSERGEGLRNTTSLLGRAGTAHGPLHWSANFDELQDFEHDIRGPFGGLGLMSDDDFNTTSTPLGPPKAGLSPDLDALAAYVSTLTSYGRSPHRDEDTGLLPPPARRGHDLFHSGTLNCSTCHTGPHLTDSALVDGQPVLHDVGTLKDSSGQRLGDTLTGVDTPTLWGLFATAPYFHDGSASTLRSVLTDAAPGSVHDLRETLTSDEISDLVSYLLCLDDSGLE